MHMWNTIQTKCGNALTEAIFTLETLSHPDSILIVNYLSEHGEASMLDLSVISGINAELLEERLELLEQMQILWSRGNLYGNKYALNRRRIARINAIVRGLV